MANELSFDMMSNMDNHPKQETTLLLVKPDGVKRGLTGEIIRRIELRGLKIVGLAMITPSRDELDRHYPKDDAWLSRVGQKTLSTYEKYGYDAKKELGTTDALEIGKEVRGWLLDFMTSGPIVKVAVQGIHAVDMVRKLVGATMPSAAEMGTIRGDFSVDSAAAANRDKRSVHNLAHASELIEEAKKELMLWFQENEIHDYKRAEEDIMF